MSKTTKSSLVKGAVLVSLAMAASTFMASSPAIATPIDLSSFSAIGGTGRWSLFNNNTWVAQINNNSQVSYFISDFNVGNVTIEWDAATRDSDDDVFGFSWGFQDTDNLYGFSWASYNSSSNGGIYKVEGGSGTLFEGISVPYIRRATYHFTLEFTPGQSQLSITRSGSIVADLSFSDSTFVDGRFGFLTGSQAANFGNLEVEAISNPPSGIPEPTTVGLLGLGLAGLICFGRKRRYY